MHTRNKKLVDFMAENGLTSKDVSEMLGVNIETVYMWRASNGIRVIPAAKFELLMLKTAVKKNV